MTNFVIKLGQNDIKNPNTMKAVQDIMDASQDAMVLEIKRVSDELGVSEDYASAIVYFRTRSRWTQELEDNLIHMCKNGDPCPNMNDY